MTQKLHDIHAREQRFSNEVLQVFARVGLPAVLEVKAASAHGPAEILFYDEVGMFGITSKSFASALAQVGDGDLTLRINSPGGDVFDAMNIYNAIRNRKQPVTCVVDGLAASAASLIAMAGSKIAMQENSMLMVHNAHTVALGDRHAMNETSDILAKVDDQLAKIYAERSNSTPEDAHAIMDKETWMTATEALALRYCDEIVEPKKEVAAKSSHAVAAASTDCISHAIFQAIDETEAEPETVRVDPVKAAKELRMRQLRLIAAAN